MADRPVAVLDPVSQALRLAERVVDLLQTVMEGQPPEVRARLWELFLARAEAWAGHAAWWDRVWQAAGDQLRPPSA